MARVPRSLIVLPGFAVHKVWRGHNKEFNIGSDDEKTFYLQVYNQDVEKRKLVQGATLQALTLMSNHTHEVFLVSNQKHFSEQMRRHHGRYGQFFNKKHTRSGKVAYDRPHTTLLENHQSEMRATFYIHANPVRANLVKDARSYAWSTHNLYAFGKRLPWMKHVKLPQWYLRLGRNWAMRQKNYRKLFAKYLKDEGKTKQVFLRARFYGSTDWVLKKEERISKWKKKKRKPPP